MEGGMVRSMFLAVDVEGVFNMAWRLCLLARRRRLRAGGVKPQSGFFVKEDFSVHPCSEYDVSSNWWKHYKDATPIGKMPRQAHLFYFDYFSAQASIKLCGDGLSSE